MQLDGPGRAPVRFGAASLSSEEEYIHALQWAIDQFVMRGGRLIAFVDPMSDAELHVLRARLRGGILNQARRGALKTPLPVGLVYDAADSVVLDPDSQVRKSIAHLFETFGRTGSATATVKHFREQELRFPRRPRGGPHKGELLWEELRHWRVLRVLHNPRYAGAFCFGRTHTHQRPGERIEIEVLPRKEWIALFPDTHPGYITWAQFEANLARLRDNAQAHGAERRKSPPREGPALLQGLAVCGVCGRRMTVRYHTRKGRQWPEYVCQSESIETATAKCQSIPGSGIDEAIGTLLVLAPKLILPMLLVFAIVLVVSGFVGLSTMAAAASLPIWLIPMSGSVELIIFSIFMAGFIIYCHRSNIQRMRDGVENRNERVMLFRRTG